MVSMKTQWSDARLGRLFDRYNRVHWSGHLPAYRVRIASFEKEQRLGQCDWKKRLIEIDTEAHASDRKIHATLLHEMVHAATRTGHGLKFFAQMERLLQRGVLATIQTGDAGGVSSYADLVPRRFRLLRQRMERLEKQRVKPIERLIARSKAPARLITGDQIAKEFGELEIAELTWKKALRVVGLEYHLTDDTGRPLNAWARRWVAKGKNVHARARRDHLDYQKKWAAYEKQWAAADEPS
jgi:hypothetical protein